MTVPEQPTARSAPTCYRHPDRETWVSCGRCGKPLCPDCMIHGPVGVRCRECLLPQGKGAGLVGAEQLKKAVGLAVMLTVAWIVVILLISAATGIRMAQWAPNPLLSAVAGGMVGWIVWRGSQRTWNAATVRAAVALGAIIPPAAALALAGYLAVTGSGVQALGVTFLLRLLFAAALSALMAWLLATNKI